MAETILLVDDEEELLDIVKSYLEMAGFNVIAATNGPQALRLLKDAMPDVIISDITMPEMSGFEFFEEVRKNPLHQHTPFIFLSGNVDFEHVKKGVELGSDEYITKPFNPDLLVSTIKGKLKRQKEITKSMGNEIQRMKDQIFQLISHEMRTPLASIMGATELLTEGKDSLSQSDFTGFLEMLKAGSDRLNKMVEDFLLVVKLESGELQNEIDTSFNAIALRKLVDRLFLELDEAISKKNLRCVVDIPGDPFLLAIRSTHLENILSRLISNAVKFSPSAGTVSVVCQAMDGSLVLRVSDEGPGIPKEGQAELFQKFNQVNRAVQEQQGTGLGLYIAKKLADLNKCTLTCESDAGKGAVFVMSIPKGSR